VFVLLRREMDMGWAHCAPAIWVWSARSKVRVFVQR